MYENLLLKCVLFLQEKYKEAEVRDICLSVKSILLSNSISNVELFTVLS
jgi:hypothetical protein